jgi:hypothetical protein
LKYKIIINDGCGSRVLHTINENRYEPRNDGLGGQNPHKFYCPFITSYSDLNS